MNAIISINIPGSAKQQVYDICAKTQKIYAQKIGVEYIVIREINQNPNIIEDENKHKRDCFYTKLKIFDYFYKYDRILYLDSDVLITQKAGNIFKVYRNDAAFYGYKLREEKAKKIMAEYPEDNYNVYNGGVMLFDKNCEIGGNEKYFLGYNDEAYFAYILRKKGINNESIDRKWNMVRKHSSMRNKFKDGCFLHYCGHGFCTDREIQKNLKIVIDDYHMYGLK